MAGLSDKASGVANEAIGKIKQSIGSAIGSTKLEVKGAAQELSGHAQQGIGDAKDAVQSTVGAGAEALHEHRIRSRAYEIWQEEGEPDGRADEHWRQAEQELDAASR